MENHHLGVVYLSINWWKKEKLPLKATKQTNRSQNISATIPTKKEFPDDNQKQNQNPSIKSGPSTLHESLIYMHLKIGHMENPTQVKETTSPFRDVAIMCQEKKRMLHGTGIFTYIDLIDLWHSYIGKYSSPMKHMENLPSFWQRLYKPPRAAYPLASWRSLHWDVLAEQAAGAGSASISVKFTWNSSKHILPNGDFNGDFPWLNRDFHGLMVISHG